MIADCSEKLGRYCSGLRTPLIVIRFSRRRPTVRSTFSPARISPHPPRLAPHTPLSIVARAACANRTRNSRSSTRRIHVLSTANSLRTRTRPCGPAHGPRRILEPFDTCTAYGGGARTPPASSMCARCAAAEARPAHGGSFSSASGHGLEIDGDSSPPAPRRACCRVPPHRYTPPLADRSACLRGRTRAPHRAPPP